MEIHDLPVLAEVEDLEALDFVFDAHVRDRDVLITRYRGTIVRPMEGGQYQLIGWQKSIYHFGGLNREVPIGVVMTTDSDGVIQGFRFDGRCEGSQGKNCDFSILHDRISEKLIGKGDMLFYPSNFPKPERYQGAFVSVPYARQAMLQGRIRRR